MITVPLNSLCVVLLLRFVGEANLGTDHYCSADMSSYDVAEIEVEIPLETIPREEPKKVMEVLQMDPAKVQKKCTVLIVTAGLSRCGKSTALNNIFDSKFESRYSSTSVTKEVKRKRSEGSKDAIVVVDTPGLGSVDIPFSKVKKDIRDAIGGLDFMLLYCHSVSPGNALANDMLVVKNLQKVLGKDIWKKCVVLFTCSDLVRSQECPRENDRDKYKRLLRTRAEELTKMMKSQCGHHVPNVKVVFDVDTELEGIEEIVAVPVGHELKEGEVNELVPGMEGLNWKEVAFLEVMRREGPMDRGAFLNLFRNKSPIYSSVAGAGVGAVVGAIGGGLIGAIGAGVGAVPGAAVGAVAGGVAGGLGSGSMLGAGALTIKEIMYRYKASKMRHKIDKLKTAELIKCQDQDRIAAEAGARPQAEPGVQQYHEDGVQPRRRQMASLQEQTDAETAMHY